MHTEFVSSVFLTFNQDILRKIYSFGSCTPEQLHTKYTLKLKATTKISVWWKSRTRIHNYEHFYALPRSVYIRYMFSNSYKNYITGYPHFATYKLSCIDVHVALYIGNKRSDIRRWLNTIAFQHIMYVGI